MSVLKHFELITYGCGNFDPEKFINIKNARFIKPNGGLWSSPVDSQYGWKEWCQSECFYTETLEEYFKFDFYGNTVVIDSLADLDQLTFISDRCIDFECLVNKGIDAIFLTDKGQGDTRLSHPKNLYGWDCECVLVMNKDCISNVRTHANNI